MTFTLPRLLEQEITGTGTGVGAIHCWRGHLPMHRLSYDSQVRGLIYETKIVQVFHNDFEESIEATYTFPLPGNAAVVQCKMMIGERVVVAELQERSVARRNYQDAIRSGKRAAIMEEERSETFNLRVGNIPPNESIRVELTMVGEVAVVHGEATFRLPLVVAPRYVSGSPLSGASVGTGVAVDTNKAPDASLVTPPTLLSGFPNPVSLSIRVRIDPLDLVDREDWWRDLRSSLHTVSVTETKACEIQLVFQEKVDRDFILRFSIAKRLVGSSLTYTRQAKRQPSPQQSDSGVFALHLVPPMFSEVPKTPLDVVFLLDHSGSMDGWKMEAACRGVGRMVDRLGDRDRFQIIIFDDKVETIGFHTNEWVEATNANRWTGVQALSRVRADGGTELGQALQTALKQFSDTTAFKRSAAIVLVTDGQVVAEDSILRTWDRCEPSRRPRIFGLGIDRAVNMSVLRRLSDRTGGTCELVESQERLDQVLERFSSEFDAPLLENIRVNSLDADVVLDRVAPCHRLTLYKDRPLTIYGRVKSLSESISLEVTGETSSGELWQEVVQSKQVAEDAVLPLWARRHLRELEDDFAASGGQASSQEIVDVSIQSGVLCRFTAFVAIDQEIVNPRGQLAKIQQPVELPEGWKEIPNRRSPGSTSLTDKLPSGQIDLSILQLVPESVAREHNMIPIAFDGQRLTIKTSDIGDLDMIEKLRFILNLNVDAVEAPASEILREINVNYGMFEGESADSMLMEFCDRDDLEYDSADSMLQEFTDTQIDFAETEEGLSVQEETLADTSPVNKLVNLMLQEAVGLRAAYVYVEPQTESTKVWFGIDESFAERDKLPRHLARLICIRLKILSKLDIVYRTRLQKGTIDLEIIGKSVRVTFYLIPTEEGESLLMHFEYATESATASQEASGRVASDQNAAPDLRAGKLFIRRSGSDFDFSSFAKKWIEHSAKHAEFNAESQRIHQSLLDLVTGTCQVHASPELAPAIEQTGEPF